MSSYERALELVGKLEAAGIRATADPRSVTPPCVLVPPPRRRVYNIGCGYSARWELVALVPGTGNADAHVALDVLVDQVAAALPFETADLTQYNLSPDNPALPAYLLAFEEGL